MKDFDLSAFLADLRTLCAIDSGHFNAPGTAAVADFFESRYRALGLKTERRYYDNNDFAPFLTARNSEDEQIDVLFVAHMDTVFPVGTSAQWPLEVDADGLAHGPGCIDCKGGCLSLYYLLRQMLQAGDCRFRFCVAMNSDEERGSDGNFISHYGVATLDGCGPCGGKMHTREEYLMTKTVEQRLDLMYVLLTRLFRRCPD